MARRRHDDHSDSNGAEDSFLDIVANIVGILILLVLVVGIRAASQPQVSENSVPPDAPLPELVDASEVDQLEEQVHSDTSKVVDLVASLRDINTQLGVGEEERALLATYTVALEQALEKEKQKLDSESAERLQVRQELATLDAEAHQLLLQKVGLDTAATKPTSLVNTPTPIVRRGIKETINVQLSNGRLAIAPLKKFEELVKNTPVDTRRRDLARGNGVARLGPIDDFELQYVIVQTFSDPGPLGTRQIKYLTFAELRPVETSCGLPVDSALEPGQSLDYEMQHASPYDTAFVVWVFPDSVSQYRPVVDHLRKHGYAVDIRLVPAGQYIAFSSIGRETTAQ